MTSPKDRKTVINGPAEQSIKKVLSACMRAIRYGGKNAEMKLYFPSSAVQIGSHWTVQLWSEGPKGKVTAIGNKKNGVLIEKMYEVTFKAQDVLDELYNLAREETRDKVNYEIDRQKRRKKEVTF